MADNACFPNAQSVLHAELLAIWFALEACYMEQLIVHVVESDSSQVIMEIQKTPLLLPFGLALF